MNSFMNTRSGDRKSAGHVNVRFGEFTKLACRQNGSADRILFEFFGPEALAAAEEIFGKDVLGETAPKEETLTEFVPVAAEGDLFSYQAIEIKLMTVVNPIRITSPSLRQFLVYAIDAGAIATHVMAAKGLDDRHHVVVVESLGNNRMISFRPMNHKFEGGIVDVRMALKR